MYTNSPDRRLRGLTNDRFLIQLNLCFISKYIFIRSNRKWLLIIWAMSTYINYNKKFCMASPEAVVQRCSEKKLLLKLLAEFTGKHLCWSLFNKVSCLQTCNFIKRDSNTGVFLWILRNFEEHLFWRTSMDDCFCISSTTLQHTTLEKLPPNRVKKLCYESSRGTSKMFFSL